MPIFIIYSISTNVRPIRYTLQQLMIFKLIITIGRCYKLAARLRLREVILEQFPLAVPHHRCFWGAPGFPLIDLKRIPWRR